MTALSARLDELEALRAAVEELADGWGEMALDHQDQGFANTATVYGAHARRLRALLAAVDGGGQ